MKQYAIFLITLLAAGLPVCSFSQQGAGKGFKISGEIKGLKSDSVFIIINHLKDDGTVLFQDTLKTRGRNDRFKFSGQVSEIKNVWAGIGSVASNKSFSFFLEPGNISIKGNIDSLSELSVKGTPVNDEQAETRGYTNAIYKRILPLRAELKNYAQGSKEFENIVSAMYSKSDSIKKFEIDYLNTHSDSYISMLYLWLKEDDLPLEEVETLYNRFPPAIRNSDYGIPVGEKIKARKRVAIGNPAPDFTSKDTSGNTVRLSDFRGKYVLLEFWANWCVPCRQQHPHLKEMYEKYAGKGFEILQYSVDDASAEQKWKDAIIHDKLVWPQVSDLAGFKSKVSQLYGVQPIPDNFLIDPDGKIIGRRLQGKELEKKLSSLLE